MGASGWLYHNYSQCRHDAHLTKITHSCNRQNQGRQQPHRLDGCAKHSSLAVGAHLSLQLFDPALGLRKTVFACDVKHNHCCCSSPAQEIRLQSASTRLVLQKLTMPRVTPVVHGSQAVVSFLPCSVPEHRQSGSVTFGHLQHSH